MKRFRRYAWFVGVVTGFVLLPAWFYLGFADNTYVQRPRIPTPEKGWTTPYPVKGITVYVSEGEATVAI